MSEFKYFALGLGLLVVYLAAMAAVLFGVAGTLAVPMFWAYVALFAALCIGASVAVYLRSPDLIKERLQPGEGNQDRVTVRALNLLMFVQLLLAGLDAGAAALVRHDPARSADPRAGWGSRWAWGSQPGPCWSTVSSRGRCGCSPSGANTS